MSDIANFVRDNFTTQGISVVSEGRKNIKVELPGDFPGLTDFVASLSNDFFAECEFTMSENKVPQLLIWQQHDQTKTEIADNSNSRRKKLFLIGIFFLVFFIVFVGFLFNR